MVNKLYWPVGGGVAEEIEEEEEEECGQKSGQWVMGWIEDHCHHFAGPSSSSAATDSPYHHFCILIATSPPLDSVSLYWTNNDPSLLFNYPLKREIILLTHSLENRTLRVAIVASDWVRIAITYEFVFLDQLQRIECLHCVRARQVRREEKRRSGVCFQLDHLRLQLGNEWRTMRMIKRILMSWLDLTLLKWRV